MLSDKEAHECSKCSRVERRRPTEAMVRMQAEMERIRALLRRIEWRGGSGDCPDCCGWDDAEGKHHKIDCELAALLQAKCV